MNITCSQLIEGPQLIPCEYTFALDAIKEKKSRIWFDIMDAGTDELDQKLDDIGVEGIIRRFVLESRDHPGFYPMKNLALMVIPVLMEEQDSDNIMYTAFLFCNDFLISIRNGDMAYFQKKITIEEKSEIIPDESIGAILSSILISLSLNSLRKTSRMSDMMISLEKKIFSDHNSVSIEKISEISTELLTIESIVQGQLPIIQALELSYRSAINSEKTVDYLIWTNANLTSASRKVDWLEHRIDIIRSMIDMKAQERMNRRLGRLTVVSMIFMPLTFLAGIWGMNFKFMPELDFRFGYGIALCAMIIIAGSMYFYFHRKGWFD